MTSWTYSATRAGYEAMWNSIAIKGGKDNTNANLYAKKIAANERTYRAVSTQTGVPWYFIGALHMRESGCNFQTHLHNGDPLRARTTHVPAGYPKTGTPPFTWVESAIDALNLKGLKKYKGQWCPALMGYVSEIYNGTGYVTHGTNSPYVWAGSNHEQTGKYIADHVWSKTFDDPQIGTMTVLKRMCELDPVTDLEMHKKPSNLVAKVAVVGGSATAAVGTVAAVASDPSSLMQVAPDVANDSVGTLVQLMPFLDIFRTTFGSYGPMIATTLTVAVIFGGVGYAFYRRRLD